MRKAQVFVAGAVLNVLFNLTTALISRDLAIKITRWGWLYFLVHLTYLLLSSKSGSRLALRARSAFGGHTVLSFVAVGLTCGLLGVLYWTGINAAYRQMFKSDSTPFPSAATPHHNIPSGPPEAVNKSSRISNRAEPREEDVLVIFKNAPFFTDHRKAVITTDLRRLRAYLMRLQLPAPTDLPPLGVSSGKWDASSGKGAYSIRYQDLRIGQGAIDSGDWEYWVAALYCDFALRPLFKKGEVPSDWFEHMEKYPGEAFGHFFSWYFAGSFLESLPKTMTAPNVEVLWEIRNKLGKATADSIMAYAALAFTESPNREVFRRGDEYMYERLLDGNSVVDNDGSNVPIIRKAWEERTHRWFLNQS